MNTQACPICGNSDLCHGIDYLDPYWADTSFFKELSISYCNNCGFGFSVPDIDDKIIENFYTSYYRNKKSHFYIDFAALDRPVGYDYRSFSQILLAKHFTVLNEGDYFVDVGPGSGASFASASELLGEPRLSAVELNEGARDAYQRIYSINTYRSVKEAVGEGIKAKIVLFSHSLEHFKLSWLADALRELKSLIASDGVLVIEVPHVDMRLHASLRFEDSPHFLFFSKDSLARLFISNGYEVCFVDTCGASYDVWWSRVQASALNNTVTKDKVGIRYAMRSIYQMLPATMKTTMRNYIRRIRLRIRRVRLPDLRGDQFMYGGDRTCLRLVARPLATHRQ